MGRGLKGKQRVVLVGYFSERGGWSSNRSDVSSPVMIVGGMKVLLIISPMSTVRDHLPRRSRVIGNARKIWANVADPPTRPINLVKTIFIFLPLLIDYMPMCLML